MVARWQAELGMAAFLAVIGVITIIGALEYGVGWSPSGPEPGAFPFYMGIIVLLASLANALRATLPLLRTRLWAGQAFLKPEQLRLVLGFTLPILGLVIASLMLGLYVGMALYLFGTLVLQNRYPVLKAGLIALTTPFLAYLLIERVFKVAMLKGPLEAWLGL
ncbi:MAG: tripartite tricarboxylate transporter TctB family protein [Beijerinckiaceae bacterium]|nr:tripartite tricarboxylate transporter TctB family protein [Beijerinckiaceae bacterium]MCZ8300086.1 tripartite tricarboxylate transporter TctB family protein [Beijerinckiaceae bacterium]